MTCGPAADGAELDAPVVDLLLEQPAHAATATATPATPTTIPRLTTALPRVAGVAAASPWPRQRKRNPIKPSPTDADNAAPPHTPFHDSQTPISARPLVRGLLTGRWAHGRM